MPEVTTFFSFPNIRYFIVDFYPMRYHMCTIRANTIVDELSHWNARIQTFFNFTLFHKSAISGFILSHNNILLRTMQSQIYIEVILCFSYWISSLLCSILMNNYLVHIVTYVTHFPDILQLNFSLIRHCMVTFSPRNIIIHTTNKHRIT